jgi:hypothetical protein
MKKFYCIIGLLFASTIVFAGGSRQYQPISELENRFYQNIDKNIWPDDVREDIDLYKNTLVGWVGIIERFMIDETNDEYNIISFYVKHHYYDWIENLDSENIPIRLSPDGEGYFVCNFYATKRADISDLTEDIIGDCIINYGSPIGINNEVIILFSNYFRMIQKIYVNSNYLPYGRNGLGGLLLD